MSKTWKLASWNVNSIKVRQEQVAEWIKETNTPIIAIQETKVEDEKFPLEIWQELGYKNYFIGQKTYNGVAILAKEELTDVKTFILDFEDPQARTISAVYNNTLIVNLYVPNGSTKESDKFIYKMKFLDALKVYLEKQLKTYKNIVVLGDFNIAPGDIDVHDPESWDNTVLTCNEVRSQLNSILDLGFKDSFRELNPDEIGFSWWDYRQASFRRDLGLRIDLILVSNALMPYCTKSFIDKEPRKNERPSDHTPVVAEFKQD
jgi:exodeoxyribonuclease-3